MARLNDSHTAHTDSTHDTESSTPVRIIGFTNHMQQSTQDDENQHAMTDSEHALMERFLLEMRQRSEV